MGQVFSRENIIDWTECSEALIRAMTMIISPHSADIKAAIFFFELSKISSISLIGRDSEGFWLNKKISLGNLNDTGS